MRIKYIILMFAALLAFSSCGEKKKKSYDEIASYASHTSQITPILNLSDFDRFELTAKINSLLAYDNHVIDDRTYEYNDNYSTDYKIIHFDGEYSDSYLLIYIMCSS